MIGIRGGQSDDAYVEQLRGLSSVVSERASDLVKLIDQGGWLAVQPLLQADARSIEATQVDLARLLRKLDALRLELQTKTDGA